jgi:hypothetical protein
MPRKLHLAVADNDFDRKLGFLGRTRGLARGLELVQRAKEQGLTLRQVVDTVTEYHPSPFPVSRHTLQREKGEAQ